MAVNGDRLGLELKNYMGAIDPKDYNFQDQTKPAPTPGGSGVYDYQLDILKAQGNAIVDEFVTYWDQTDSGIYLRLNGRTGGQEAHGGLVLGETLSLQNNLQSGSGITIEADGTLVTNVTNYENLVTSNNDIPNKKYVDDHAGGITDHTLLNNLTSGDSGHTQFALLSGRAGGQTITGGTLTSQNLLLRGNATDNKGFTISSTGLLTSSESNYESLVIADDDIPNKKYVDDKQYAHTSLSGLTTTDAGHTQFAMLNGRAGGQILTGGTLTTQTLILKNNAVDAKLFTIEGDGTLSTTTSSYESLVTSDNDIPNKKYVDTHQFAHSGLSGLTTSDAGHTQFALLTGRSGGQTIQGDTASGGSLTLQSTAHATKGKILFGSASAYDEVNKRFGIGNATPTFGLEVVCDPAITGGANIFNIKNSGDTTADRHIRMNFSHSNSIGAAINALRLSGASDGSSMSFYTQPSGGSVTERLKIASTGDISISSTTEATSSTAASVMMTGGLGVAKKIITGGTIQARGGFVAGSGRAGIYTDEISILDTSGLMHYFTFESGILISYFAT